MTLPHRTRLSGMDEFTLRCACGTQIHSSDAHLGRTIRCRCGRSVLIERPTVTAPPPRQEPRTRQAPPPTRSPKPRLRQRLQRATQAVTRALAGTSDALRKEFSRRRRPLTRTAAWLQLVYLVGVVATWLALIMLSERWLPATLLTYGPRLVVLLPLVVLVPLGLLAARRSLLFTVAGGLVATTQIMGFVVGLGPQEPPYRSEADRVALVRVITLNVSGARTPPEALNGLIARYEPDVVALQECGPELAASLRARPDWHVATHQGLCTTSRWPLGERDTMPRAEFQRIRQLGFGGNALVVRYRVLRPGLPFTITNLHLETARKGLEGLISEDGLLPDGMAELPALGAGSARVQANALIRTRESEQASTWSAAGAASMPALVAGDFNMPVESTIYRRYWRAFENAFDAKGRGLGYSKTEGRLLRLRIDHVLAAPGGFEATGAWLGPEVGSDHRPLIADLTLDSP